MIERKGGRKRKRNGYRKGEIKRAKGGGKEVGIKGDKDYKEERRGRKGEREKEEGTEKWL